MSGFAGTFGLAFRETEKNRMLMKLISPTSALWLAVTGVVFTIK
jgi:hypothetical protein